MQAMTLRSVGNSQSFLEAVNSQEPVTGLTHEFYRYPARFSPVFAREAIRLFTEPGDLVLDPFSGGGTTLVEAACLGRRAIGIDISSLATFLARVKTTELSTRDISIIRRWAQHLPDRLNLRNSVVRPSKWIQNGYQRNINTRETWPIRKALELGLAYVSELPSQAQRDFARCVLLRTGQWALDSRKNIPSVAEFRPQLLRYLEEMIAGVREFRKCTPERFASEQDTGILCLHRSAAGIEADSRLQANSSPRLILTSPPYPGVHVLYHRWQVQGRREAPAPFWIANCMDGHGESYYTFGHRGETELRRYFRKALANFRSLARVSDENTLLIQMVGFSDRSWQLPRYLETLERAGFTELRTEEFANSADGRLWRVVPNRKWYADQRGDTDASKEVVLFHRLPS